MSCSEPGGRGRWHTDGGPTPCAPAHPRWGGQSGRPPGGTPGSGTVRRALQRFPLNRSAGGAVCVHGHGLIAAERYCRECGAVAAQQEQTVEAEPRSRCPAGHAVPSGQAFCGECGGPVAPNTAGDLPPHAPSPGPPGPRAGSATQPVPPPAPARRISQRVLYALLAVTGVVVAGLVALGLHAAGPSSDAGTARPATPASELLPDRHQAAVRRADARATR